MVVKKSINSKLIPFDLLEIKKNYHNRNRFLYLFELIEEKYSKSQFRLAGEDWEFAWQTLIVTILSAQSKDELTIIISEELFRKYKTLEDLANANFDDVLHLLKSMNYNKTKTKHIILTAQLLIEKFNSIVPKTIDELITLPGVGRKTANLVISEEFNIPGICVDTHVNRICNIFNFVQTKDNRDLAEKELKSFIPNKYWSRINRLFVLLGKECSSKDPKVILDHILYEELKLK